MKFKNITTRLIVSFLALTLIFTNVFSNTTLANENQKSTLKNEEITNFEYITQTDEKLEYTFTQNGSDYKIIEFLNPNEVVSHFYEKNPVTNEFEKYDTMTTTVLEDEEIIKYHSESTNEIVTNDISEPEQEIQEPLFSTRAAGFKYSHTNYGTNTPARWTVGAIALTIAAITKVPAPAKWVVNMANLSYQLGKGNLYYKYDYYKKGSGAAMKTRTKRTVYIDSNRKNAIGASLHEYGRSGSKLIATYKYK